MEENICTSRRIQEQDEFENMHAHEQIGCQYNSYLEQDGNDHEVDLEKQQACELISDLGQNSSIFVEYSRDRYESKVQD